MEVEKPTDLEFLMFFRTAPEISGEGSVLEYTTARDEHFVSLVATFDFKELVFTMDILVNGGRVQQLGHEGMSSIEISPRHKVDWLTCYFQEDTWISFGLRPVDIIVRRISSPNKTEKRRPLW